MISKFCSIFSPRASINLPFLPGSHLSLSFKFGLERDGVMKFASPPLKSFSPIWWRELCHLAGWMLCKVPQLTKPTQMESLTSASNARLIIKTDSKPSARTHAHTDIEPASLIIELLQVGISSPSLSSGKGKHGSSAEKPTLTHLWNVSRTMRID